MTKPRIKISRIKYVPIVQHWRRLRPLFQSSEAERIWRLNMRDYAQQRAVENKYKHIHRPSRIKTPSDYDSCDWRFGRRGRPPEFWKYVCHSACHWLVDLHLHVASMAFPKWQWRIVTSGGKPCHSTLWNGDIESPMLFDLNFLALEVTAKEAWQIASKGRFLKPGEVLRPYVFEKGYFA